MLNLDEISVLISVVKLAGLTGDEVEVEYPQWKPVLKKLEKYGLVVSSSADSWTDITEKGEAYLEMLNEVPLPVIKYVDPRGKISL